MSFLTGATAQLDRPKSVGDRLGPQNVDLNRVATSGGFGIAFGAADYVVVAVAEDGTQGNAYITSWVFRDINQDRLAALEACNGRVSSSPAFPMFLHSSQPAVPDHEGWGE